MVSTQKISVITPSLNQGKFIEKTIQSIINQRYSNLEYIIIDGGSTDNTLEIIKKYEKHLSYWISEKDSGQSNAINKGFKKATGDIIAWLNSDDEYCEDIFEKLSQYFIQNKNVLWIYGNTYFIDENENIITYKKPIKFNKFVLRYGSFSFNQPGVFLRRKILSEVGLLNEDFHAIMDQEWFCRISEKYEPDYVDIDIAKFRWHPNSKSSSEKYSNYVRRLNEERQILFDKYVPNLSFFYKKFPRLFFFLMNSIARIIKLYYRIIRL